MRKELIVIDKSKINAEIDSLVMTQDQATNLGFENPEHYKSAFKKMMELIESCMGTSGDINIRAMLTMAINLMKAVYLEETKNLSDDAKLEKSKSFFNLAMAMVLESIGGALLSIDGKPIVAEEKSKEPLPLSSEKKDNETLH